MAIYNAKLSTASEPKNIALFNVTKEKFNQTTGNKCSISSLNSSLPADATSNNQTATKLVQTDPTSTLTHVPRINSTSIDSEGIHDHPRSPASEAASFSVPARHDSSVSARLQSRFKEVLRCSPVCLNQVSLYSSPSKKLRNKQLLAKSN